MLKTISHLKAIDYLKSMFMAAMVLLISAQAFAAESIDRTQPYQMMTHVAEVAFERLKMNKTTSTKTQSY